ncbi:MAG: DsbA family protein [Ghiorsea sp.]
MKLYYVHDPMCSWCWAFRPVFKTLLSKLPQDIEVEYLVGGLAPDSSEPMDIDTQLMIQKHWHTIEKRVPNTQFNFDFWTQNTPKRSTYPACRAVLAAKIQNAQKEDEMILAIQQAYYLSAKNPSDDEVLKNCANEIGLDVTQFENDFQAPTTQDLLLKTIQRVRNMPVAGFPSLVLKKNGQFQSIRIDYVDAEKMLLQIKI